MIETGDPPPDRLVASTSPPVGGGRGFACASDQSNLIN
jgi:hypothetical protein